MTELLDRQLFAPLHESAGFDLMLFKLFAELIGGRLKVCREIRNGVVNTMRFSAKLSQEEGIKEVMSAFADG